MTITTTSANIGTCGLNITSNRNRIKMYDHTVYLRDGQKFEIELHNPHTYTVLAKIKLNGYYISQSGIVLNPGQRVYLERYIDKDESFIFSTYDVEGTAESKAAIAYNGDVEVEFYAQHNPSSSLLTNWNTTGSYTYYNTNTTNLPNTFYCQQISLTGSATTAGTGISFTTTTTPIATSTSTKTIETGRIEGGNKSGQKLGKSNDSFNSWVFESKKIKIMPLSGQPVEVSELRNYCTNCGTRAKKASWKFCPSCGTKM